jgi:hypothetical protein
LKYGILCGRTDDGNRIVFDPVKQTTSALERMRGLLGRPPLQHGEGLLIQPCNSVHTLFMRYKVDVIYLDRNFRVLKVVPAMSPYRMSMAVGAAAVLELSADQAVSCGIHKGICFTWEDR